MSILSKLSIAASTFDHGVKKFLFDMFDTATPAAAGSSQATGTLLTAGKNFVTAADGTKGVVLPVAVIGMEVVVVNTVSNQVLKVYPNTGAIINALAANGAFSQQAGSNAVYRCDLALHWYVAAANLTGVATTATQAELDVLAGVTAGTGAASKALVLDAGEDAVWPATGVLTYGVLKDPAGTTLGATVAELNMAADSSANVELVTTTNVIVAAESGKTFFLNSATDFLSTLPAPAAGLRFTFIVKTAATTTAHTIGTNGGADVIFGAVATADGNASVLASAEDLISLTKTATGGIVGDRIDLISDGTNWYVSGLVSVAAGITFTVT